MFLSWLIWGRNRAPFPMPKSIIFSQLLTWNSQLENLETLKIRIQYRHVNLYSFFAVKTKNKAILCFKHRPVCLKSKYLCLKYFVCFNFSQFPEFTRYLSHFWGPRPHSQNTAKGTLQYHKACRFFFLDIPFLQPSNLHMVLFVNIDLTKYSL